MADEIFVGSVAVGVVPDLRGFNEKVTAEVVPEADAIGKEFGSRMGKSITDSMGDAGGKSGDAFATKFKYRVDAALKALPKVQLDADSTEVDVKLQEIRDKLKEINKQRLIDPEQAVADLDAVKLELDDLKLKSKDIRLTFDTVEARAQLDLLSKDIARKTGDTGGSSGGILSNLVRWLFTSRGGGGASTGGAGGSGIGGIVGLGEILSPGGSNAGQGVQGVVGALGTAPPVVQAGAIAAALAALPLVAQAAAGGIAAAFSGGLAAIGIYGAIESGKLTKQWDDFTSKASADVKKIGASWVPTLSSMLSTAQKVMGQITPIFVNAEKVIAGPMKIIGDTIIRSFADPQVTSSITAMAHAFAAFLNAFAPDIPGIINSFADAIERIAASVSKNPKAFADFLNILFQFIIAIVDGIAFLTDFADYVELHFIPAIKDIARWFEDTWHSVENITNEVLAWFGNFWKEMTASTKSGVATTLTPVNAALRIWSNWWQQYGQDVKNIWHALWLALVDIFKPILNLIIDLTRSGWSIIVDLFRSGASAVRVLWNTLWIGLETIVKVAVNTITTVVRFAWVVVQNDTKIIWSAIQAFIKSVWDIIIGIIEVGLDLLNGRWSAAWNTILNTTRQVWNNLKTYFSSLMSDLRNIASAGLSALYNLFVQNGKDVISGFYNGMKAAISGVGSWIKANVVDPVVNAVKHYFGIHSPATVMIPVGQSVVAGMLKGIFTSGANLAGFISTTFGGWPQALGSLVQKGLVDIAKLPEKALSALGNIAGKVGGFFAQLFGGKVSSGVSQWAGLVAKALSMLGLPLTLASKVLYQMQTESGGNPNAINLTDINAQMGDPSRGLLQTIGTTFATYHVAGTSNNIYDPLANIAAAINYARAVYGPTLERGGMGMGSGHGYDAGGWLPTGTSVARNLTGSPELVLSPGQLATAMGGHGGPTYNAYFDSLTGQAIEAHVQAAFQAMALTQGRLQRHGRRT